MMYFLRYRAMPAKTHPERDRYGEALVCCWIDRRTLATADRVARRQLRAEKWDVLERDAGEKVTEADYDEGDEWLEHYRQALTDTEVFVYHLSPRSPVYCVIGAVKQGSPPRAAEAMYLASGESLLRDGEDDVSVPGFWDARRRAKVVAAARKAIREAGWTVTAIRDERPVGPTDLAEDFVAYYDEAEDRGSCLVFIGATAPK